MKIEHSLQKCLEKRVILLPLHILKIMQLRSGVKEGGRYPRGCPLHTFHLDDEWAVCFVLQDAWKIHLQLLLFALWAPGEEVERKSLSLSKNSVYFVILA